jgi:hypothetical protein
MDHAMILIYAVNQTIQEFSYTTIGTSAFNGDIELGEKHEDEGLSQWTNSAYIH